MPVISILTAPFSPCPKKAFPASAVYTASTAKLDGIFVLTVPFSLPSNRALLLRIMTLLEGRENGCVKTKIPSNFPASAVYLPLSLIKALMKLGGRALMSKKTLEILLAQNRFRQQPLERKMFRRIIQIGCLSLALIAEAYCGKSDFITYEWLIDTAQKTGYTDHIPHFRRLFNTLKVRGFLECGCGFSTKYFMDNCDEVTSIEFMTKGTSDIWFNECLRLYSDCSNWVPLAYNADLKNDSFDNACGYQCSIIRLRINSLEIFMRSRSIF